MTTPFSLPLGRVGLCLAPGGVVELRVSVAFGGNFFGAVRDGLRLRF